LRDSERLGGEATVLDVAAFKEGQNAKKRNCVAAKSLMLGRDSAFTKQKVNDRGRRKNHGFQS